MTIAAGMLCEGGIVFGADTEESIGDLHLRVHKIPTDLKLPGMITGACMNGNLMDAAVERIFDSLKEDKFGTSKAVGKLLDKVMMGLYEREFKVYPDPTSTRMQLLVAVKPRNEDKARGWSIDCSSVRRMKSLEVEGSGILVRFLAEQLYASGISVESGVIAMVQVLSAAKKLVAGVGGESYVHVLRDDGSLYMKNFRFSPEEESLYEFFIEHGRGLILATGNSSIGDEQFEVIANHFIADLKWKRKRITPKITPSDAQKPEPEP